MNLDRSIFLIGLNHTYQYKQAINASPLERAQRQQFRDYVRDVIAELQPTIIADESPDTSNMELLGLYPDSALKVCVDIPFEVKVRSNLMVGRPDGELCPMWTICVRSFGNVGYDTRRLHSLRLAF